jgi:GT2 family glycosyltransferase
MERICAVVVTYNRKHLLLECINGIKNQSKPVDAIYIIDNASTDGTPQLLLEKGFIKQLPPSQLSEPWESKTEIKGERGKKIDFYYLRMDQNKGGAGGFYEGVKRGVERGFDWLWLMDDDAEPLPDALEKLVPFFQNEKVVAIAGKVTLPNGEVVTTHRGVRVTNHLYLHKPLSVENLSHISKIDMASFVGVLIRKKAVEKIGYPNKSFFIFHDDEEYSLRLRKVGDIIFVPDSIILHKEQSKKGIEKTFLGRKSVRIPFDRLWLNYYGIRNWIYLMRQYNQAGVKFWSKVGIKLIKTIAGIILFDDHKWRRIRLIVNGYIDGIRGHFDNEKPRRILYE